jgi:hypothetical protein
MEKISIKKTTLISIMKESQKCDSLRVAFNSKSQLLDSLVSTNMLMFTKLEIERNARLSLQGQLNEKQDKLLKQTKKAKSGWIIPTLIGSLLGLIAGVSL